MQAHVAPNGKTRLGGAKLGEEPAALPCGKCLGCQTAKGKEWALRCHLELQQHDTAAFTTLTYEEKYCPPTLNKRDLQLFLKRIRRHVPTGTVRFFGCGEYGEKNGRPHYHAILFGIRDTDAKMIEETWGMGLTETTTVTPARVNYVAGYTSKNKGSFAKVGEQIDAETGEVFTYQPPFLQMSRRPGIGGGARKFVQSWRQFAINNGTRMPVPRFLHNAWQAQATDEQKEQLKNEIKERQKQQQKNNPITLERLLIENQIRITNQAIAAGKRKI
jgi:hypothetical protein